MEEIIDYKISQLGTVVTGKTPSSQFPEEFGNDMPFITPTDFKYFHKWADFSERSLSKQGIDKLITKVLPPKSVLVTCIGSDMGKVAINKAPVITNQQLNSIIPDSKIVNSEFLYYKLVDSYDILRMHGQAGTAVPIVNKGEFENIILGIPKSLTYQEKVAELLSEIDNKIDLLTSQVNTLEQLAETLFRQWFIEEAKDNWQENILSQHTEVFRGLSYKGSGLVTKENGVPMHNLNSIYEGGGYKYEGIKYYNGEYRERHQVNAGDIIVANTEQGHEHKLIGYPAIIPTKFKQVGLFSQHIYKLSPLNTSYLTKEFLYYLLMSSKVREQITGATNGSTVNMLAIDGLQITKFLLPPKEKVMRFTEIVRDYWFKKENNYTQIETLQGLRDELLPKLISGEITIAE